MNDKIIKFLLMLGFCLVLGCGGGNSENYYPLEEGRSWEYICDILDEGYNKIGSFNYKITNMPEITLQNRRVTPQKIEMVLKDKTKISWEFYSKVDDGVILVGKNQSEELSSNIKPLYYPEYIMIYPPKIGAVREELGIYKLEIDCMSDKEAKTVVPAGVFDGPLYCASLAYRNELKKGPSSFLRQLINNIGMVQFTIQNYDGSAIKGKLSSYKK
jgi:hypothetical protein